MIDLWNQEEGVKIDKYIWGGFVWNIGLSRHEMYKKGKCIWGAYEWDLADRRQLRPNGWTALTYRDCSRHYDDPKLLNPASYKWKK